MTTRRQTIKAITAGVVGSSFTGEASSKEKIDLGDEGLSSGDDITEYLDEYLASERQVYIPAGEYDGDLSVLEGTYSDMTLTGDPNGVEIHRPPPETPVEPRIECSDGELLFENVIVRGKKGEEQSDIRPECHDNTITFRNWNYPDGTVDGSDSQAFYAEETGGGTLRFEDCYIGPHGNSPFYIEVSDYHCVIDGCTIENSNTAFRPSEAGMTVRNTICIADDIVPRFSEDGDVKNAMARFFRIKGVSDTTVDVENVHWTQRSSVEPKGRLFDVRAPTTFNINGLFMYNELSDEESVVNVEDDVEWNVSNAHISGPGHTETPFETVGTETPEGPDNVWTL